MVHTRGAQQSPSARAWRIAATPRASSASRRLIRLSDIWFPQWFIVCDRRRSALSNTSLMGVLGVYQFLQVTCAILRHRCLERGFRRRRVGWDTRVSASSVTQSFTPRGRVGHRDDLRVTIISNIGFD
jgi:hypothetical protein